MKHLYRNIICILLIIVAICGILLVSLNWAGILGDNLDMISRAISNGDVAQKFYDALTKDQEVLTIDSDYNGSFYLKNESCGDVVISGNTADFDQAKQYKGEFIYNPLGFYAKKIQMTGADKHHATITTKKRNLNLLRPDYTDEGLTGIKSDSRVADSVKKGHSYDFDFYPEYNLEELQKKEFDEDILMDELEYRQYVHEEYTHLVADYNPKSASKVKEEKELKDRILNYLDNKNLNPNSPTFIQDVHDYFNKYYFYQELTKDEVSKDKNIILSFLEDTDHGICNNFASASVYLYRAAGIPTRFVTGYLAYDPIYKNGQYHYSVTKKCCHAWNEVYIDGSGWMRIDNTSARTDLDVPNMDDFLGLLSSLSFPDSISTPDISFSTSSVPIPFDCRYIVYATLNDVHSEYSGEEIEPDFNEYFKVTEYDDLEMGKNHFPDQEFEEKESYTLEEVLSNINEQEGEMYNFVYHFKKDKKNNRVNATSSLNLPFSFVCDISIVNSNDPDEECNETFEFILTKESTGEKLVGLSNAAKGKNCCNCYIDKRTIEISATKEIYSFSFYEDAFVGDVNSLFDISNKIPYHNYNISFNNGLKKSDFDETGKLVDFEDRLQVQITDLEGNDVKDNYNIEFGDMELILKE